MKVTNEQQAIIDSTGDIKINAVAGSGKTTTVIAYAKARPRNAKILYLAFNKAVKLEAAKKFTEAGLNNVKVETAHSLAYKHIVFSRGYKVRQQDFKTYEIAALLGLKGSEAKHSEYIVANHIIKFIAYFCNSDKEKVQDLNYLDVVSDPKAKTFVRNVYAYIEKQTRVLLAKMDKGEIDITHDFYLKKFQLQQPQLGYDYILFDEAQDASPAMLSIFLNQQATKVIVGDTHQQIYGWRHAVNSLEKADFSTLHLSASFRFGQDIANLAMAVLDWKHHLQAHKKINITGKGTSTAINSKAVIARTNLGLLLKAIEYVTEKKDIKGIYFEGNINSYTYADEGASLYDVLNLSNGKHHLIKDTLVKAMKDIDDLEEYVKTTEDAQLSMMLDIVKKYGDKIPGIIKQLKDKHVDNNDKDKAEIIFSTVHRCKGMEYDSIQLVNDFITEEKLEKILEDKEENIDRAKLNEEINLLYVAITRTKCQLNIPETLVPAGFAASPNIRLLQVETKTNTKETYTGKSKYAVIKKEPTEKKYSLEKAREINKDAYRPWTEEQDNELTIMYCDKLSLNAMAEHFGRTKGAILSRIKKLELGEIYG